MVSMDEFDPLPSKSLASELPALEAAESSLVVVVSQLEDALVMCPKANRLLGTKVASAFGKEAEAFEFDEGVVTSLMKEARSVIMAARNVFFVVMIFP